jgi:hypothetical protein
MTHQNDRRRFVRGMLGVLAAPLALPAGAIHAANSMDAANASNETAQQPGTRLAPWTPGCLDIHHIATGRGNATFILMPDGTSLLIDAGSTNDKLDVSAAPRPSAERRPGEWIGRYVRRHPTRRRPLGAGLSAGDAFAPGPHGRCGR